MLINPPQRDLNYVCANELRDEGAGGGGFLNFRKSKRLRSCGAAKTYTSFIIIESVLVLSLGAFLLQINVPENDLDYI